MYFRITCKFIKKFLSKVAEKLNFQMAAIFLLVQTNIISMYINSLQPKIQPIITIKLTQER